MRLRGGIIILGLILAFSFAFSFLEVGIDLSRSLSGASLTSPLGFDDLGRNYLVLLARGTLTSLFFSFISVSISFFLGTLLSLFLSLLKRGYELALSILDSVRMLPVTVVAIFLSSFFLLGELRIVISLVVVFTPMFTRISFLKLSEIRNREYILFLSKSRVSRSRVFFCHVVPHLWLSIRGAYGVYLSTSILLESTLSYLGLGLREERPSLGSIMANAKDYMLYRPSLLIYPTLIMLLISLSLYLISSSLGEFDSSLKRPLKGKLVNIAKFSSNRKARGES